MLRSLPGFGYMSLGSSGRWGGGGKVFTCLSGMGSIRTSIVNFLILV
jgi:hypothetical protein